MNGMHDLDDLFAEAQGAAPLPSAALVARVLAGADALQPQAAPMRRSPPAPAGFWAALGTVFGGGGMLAGLGTAAAAGLFMGFVQPLPVTALTDALGVTTLDTSYDFLPGIDPLIAEE